jgi:hypothetical protein
VLHLLCHKGWRCPAEHKGKSRNDKGCQARKAFAYHRIILKEESSASHYCVPPARVGIDR